MYMYVNSMILIQKNGPNRTVFHVATERVNACCSSKCSSLTVYINGCLSSVTANFGSGSERAEYCSRSTQPHTSEVFIA